VDVLTSGAAFVGANFGLGLGKSANGKRLPSLAVRCSGAGHVTFKLKRLLSRTGFNPISPDPFMYVKNM